MPQSQDLEKIVPIPGVGDVHFPASMTDDQINAAAAKLYREKNPQSAPKPQKSWIESATDWLPTVGGAAGGMLGGIPGAALGGAAGEGLRTTLTHLSELPGAIKDVAVNLYEHPRETIGGFAQGMEEGKQNAMNAALMQGGAQAGGELIAAGARAGGQKLMQSALKPAYKTVERAIKNVELPRVIKTLLTEGVNVTPGGIGKINSILGATNDEIDDLIRASAGSVDPADVARAGYGVMNASARQVAPGADMAASQRVIDDFLSNAGAGPIPVQTAQALKQGTYRAIGNRAYGETQGAALETEKALARGLKEGIEKIVPDVKGLNAREAALIEARDAIAKRVAMAANRDPAGLGWLAENPSTFLGFLMSRSPAVKSMLARGLYQSASRAAGVPENLIRFAVQALATSADEEPTQ